MINVDELVEIVSYDFDWPKLYKNEAEKIKVIFNKDRLVKIEHFGCTAIPGIKSKPIIDILVGLSDFYLNKQEKELLQNIGYEYVGRARNQDRFYLVKRDKQDFNLAVVKYGNDLWSDNLLIRDYLRIHPQEVKKYSQIKEQALREGFTTLFAYSDFKQDFVFGLLKKAKKWRTK